MVPKTTVYEAPPNCLEDHEVEAGLAALSLTLLLTNHAGWPAREAKQEDVRLSARRPVSQMPSTCSGLCVARRDLTLGQTDRLSHEPACSAHDGPLPLGLDP